MDFSAEFLARLEEAERLVFFTGAGISVESGIPVFRGKDGIWNKLKPEELANFDAFMKNPDIVWEWYQYRKQIVNNAQPNKGHLAIAELQDIYPEVTVVTQNVDNLHNRAGSKTVYELHGNIERNYCIKCKTFYNEKEFASDKVPKCEKCGGLIRPDIVWFGEFLPEDQFSGGERATAKSDLCFVVGTSAVVYPAAYIPMTAKKNGSAIVEINIEETELTYYADFSFFGKSEEILPQIVEAARVLKNP